MSDSIPASQSTVRLSVRNLAEFLLKTGDIDNRRRAKEKDAMQEGTRIHKKIQKSMGASYQPEVFLKEAFSLKPFIRQDAAFSELSDGEEDITLVLEGRADGIMDNMRLCHLPEKEIYQYTSEYGPMEPGSRYLSNWRLPAAKKADQFLTDSDTLLVFTGREEQGAQDAGAETETGPDCPLIDEIKGVSRPVNHITEPVPVHLAQALCYTYLYCLQKRRQKACIQITYCNMESEEIRRFRRVYTMEELQGEMDCLLREYAQWAVFTVRHNRQRDETIRTLQFPFSYRPGQKKLAACVYQTIRQKKNIFIQAPTGIGKTLSTTFPAVKAMGEGMAQKIFYLTAKTIARTVAEESFALMRQNGLFFSSITITAKEKWCVLEEMACNPVSCPRAQGHFDRVNRAVYDFITHESVGSRENILAYAEKHQVCPFELCLDLTYWMDAIICDYNYVFDPNVYLQRYFGEGTAGDYIFLVDEAHNLVDRARSMYSAAVCKEDILQAAKIYGEYPDIRKRLNRINRQMLALKRECEDYVICPEGKGLEDLAENMDRLYANLQEFPDLYPEVELPREANDFFFLVRDFVMVWDRRDDHYKVYMEILEDGRFMVRLFCVNPSRNLRECMNRGRTTVFFSATLLPMPYYRRLLSGMEEDYAVYVDSPFAEENRILCISRDTTSRYTRRGEFMYKRIASCILRTAQVMKGNYMAFFPSYQFMEQVAAVMKREGFSGQILLQENNMSEEERENFLNHFTGQKTQGKPKQESLIGCCVIGGSFSEGIDLREDSLIGVFVVGTGIPLVCTERKILQQHFDEESGNGYDFAYRYPGMNKVLQAAGRLIRTPEDVGVIVLLDDRFLQPDYMRLFPREWKHYCPVTAGTIFREVEGFWAGVKP